MARTLTAGILALQGGFEAHAHMFELAGAKPKLVRTARELSRVDVLAMPGGESTTMSMLLDRSDLRGPLVKAIQAGLPVLATCAGMILCAKQVEGDRGSVKVRPLGVMDTLADRNAYGRQVNSFEATLKVDWRKLGLAKAGTQEFHGVFIRAPRLVSWGKQVTPVAWQGDAVVAIRQGRIIATAFHPELADDPRFHAALLALAVQH